VLALVATRERAPGTLNPGNLGAYHKELAVSSLGRDWSGAEAIQSKFCPCWAVYPLSAIGLKIR
jgi:hypothetical protein